MSKPKEDYNATIRVTTLTKWLMISGIAGLIFLTFLIRIT